MQNAQEDACNLKKFQYNKGEKPNRTSADIFWKEVELMHKKRFLRLVSAVLALCMMAALLPTAAFAADPEPTPTPASSFTFSYDEDTKTASVTGFTGSETKIEIPGTVWYEGNAYTVTSIGARALQKCSATSIRIPASVTKIEKNAIYWCNSLKTVTFEENSQLTSIGWMAFYYNKALKSVEIPVGVTSIGDSAFGECDSLTGIKIPSSVTTIGEKAFNQCFALNEITIPSSVTSIGKDAFRFCKGLKSVQFEENSKLTSIPDGMFECCSNLKSVKLPSSITSIGEMAFSECESLPSIVIPESVTSIGKHAFSKCSALESVEFGKNSQLASIGESAFLNCGSLESIEIPDSVTNIGMYAFGMCKKLTSVDFGENSRLADITQSMFFECEKLTGVELPSSIKSIGLSAFWDSGLISIEIPDGVTTIGEGVFRECDDLQTVTIPASVTNVASDIFGQSKNPKTIYFKGTEEQWENLKFDPTGTDSPEITISYLRTVKFDPNGHGTAPENVYVKNGETIDCPTLSETGYNLDGWYYTENGIEKKFVFGETKVTSDLTLTAKWTKGSYTLTVDGNAEGHDYDEEVTVDEPTKEGYTFAGWTVEAGNVTPQKGDDGKWRFQMPAGNVTLTAEWKINEYTVIFVTAYDNTPNSLTVKHGETISGDRVLKADGYEFGGWYNGTEKFVFGENGTKVTGNLTLTARWTEVKKPEPKPDPKPVVYEIVVDNGTAYLDDGATAIHTAEEGQTVILKVNPEALTEGFAFDQWEVVSGDVKLADATASETRFEMPASDVELKATVKAVESPAAPAAINPASVMAGTVALGVGAVSVGWSAYHIATELYLKWVLPQGIIPTTRGQLALLLWNQADQPAVESTAVYTDIDASDEQTAARWVIENKKMELVNSDEEDVFEPDLPVDIFAVAKAWRKK